MRSNTQPPRRDFLKVAAAGAMTAVVGPGRAQEAPEALPGTMVSTSYPQSTATHTVSDPSRIAVLQFTDAHFFQNRKEVPDGNERTVADWKTMVDLYRPDLIAMTGDLWHDNPDNRGAEFQQQATEWLGELGVPWVYTWGNHDRLDDQVKGHDVFHDATGSLYRGGPQRGNYTVSITDRSGKAVWELICINTHRHGLVGPGYDWLKALADSRAASGTVHPPAFGLFHIPVQQYWDLRTKGGMAGFAFEDCCNEEETGAALPVLQALKTIRACFCGHDHVNDYSGLTGGIELTYGRASGWNGYGWNSVRKGAKLITMNAETGNYAWETVFPDGLRWHPGPNERIEEQVDEPWMRPPALTPT